ncbi:Lnb N-terminal periplasmic domain-containing protein [Hymenobacter rigui]|uniref:DUF4105 domain-containing protein n=1 Tax=Hymenobacter rigui TaxID=334424 RepID=A0A3R9MLR0_9BACT|nr:DUF4105 domain-containing protein [Hymenobacter rigui]RSK48723.1 DUF4105 domain-containing protein [Hymenobacter rigui]
MIYSPTEKASGRVSAFYLPASGIRLLLLAFLWVWGAGAAAATPATNDTLAISLLTCAPGSETYALFGHSALRVTNPGRGLDRVYNYGTFDFRTPNFYWRFLRGDLRYFLSATSFAEFRKSYRQENRAVTEQVLALRQPEAQLLHQQLETTLHSGARFYQYQFFTDNCTTRLLGHLRSVTQAQPLHHYTYADSAIRYRQLLAPYLAPAPWVSFGINIGLGMPADRYASFEQRLFLPLELQRALAHASRLGRPFVQQTRPLLTTTPPRPPQVFTPSFFLVGLGLLLLLAQLLPARYSLVPRVLQSSFLAAAGLMGCFLVGLQLISLHSPVHANYQVLWLQPTHLLWAFVQPRRVWRPFLAAALLGIVVGGSLGWVVDYIEPTSESGLLLGLLFWQLLVLFRRCGQVAEPLKQAGVSD